MFFFGVCLNLKCVFWEFMLKSEAPTNRHISYTKTVSFPSWDPINRHPEALCMLALAACNAGSFFLGAGAGFCDFESIHAVCRETHFE